VVVEFLTGIVPSPIGIQSLGCFDLVFAGKPVVILLLVLWLVWFVFVVFNN